MKTAQFSVVVADRTALPRLPDKTRGGNVLNCHSHGLRDDSSDSRNFRPAWIGQDLAQIGVDLSA